MGTGQGRRNGAVRRFRHAAIGLAVGLVTLGALPLSSAGDTNPVTELKHRLQSALGTVLAGKPAPATPDPAAATREQARKAELLRAEEARRKRERLKAEDAKTDPPLHGTDPHAQGTVGVVDTTPSAARPQGGNPNGSDAGEEIVIGRARGMQNADGSYHGHITIVGLFGNEILGVDTAPGQNASGPLSAVQNGVLQPLCNGTGNQVCLSAVTADSSTTATGTTNHYSTAHATLGGAAGLDVGVAESDGNISNDAACQTAHSDASVAGVKSGGVATADAAQSTTDSKACKGQAPTQTNTSKVINLGGVGVPIPDPGCANGTPDVLTGIPVVAPIVCNADDQNGAQAAAPYGVRDALSVFALDLGGTTVLKTSTAGSESRAVPPPPQCSDKADNDGDGQIDANDPGCLSGPGGAYNPNDDDETNAETSKPQCSDGKDNDGDGKVDAKDPGCHTDGNADNPNSYNPKDDNESNGGKPQCSDGRDNDGDGKVDAQDPGCHSDGDASNPDSYNPNDDNEANGGGARELGSAPDNGQLPFTGVDVVLIMIAGLLLLGGGLGLRSRTRTRPERVF